MKNSETMTVPEAHQHFAKVANVRVWELLSKQDRSPAEDDDLLYAAFASCYHWRYAGDAVHQQRGEYLIAKACISLGMPEQALRHAEKCLSLTVDQPAAMEDFDVAFAYEIVARAYAMCGRLADAQMYIARAQDAGRIIEDAEDRQIFTDDLRSGPWFGLETA